MCSCGHYLTVDLFSREDSVARLSANEKSVFKVQTPRPGRGMVGGSDETAIVVHTHSLSMEEIHSCKTQTIDIVR